MKLNDKKVVVTGASSGIGLATYTSHIRINAAYFPDISKYRPMAVVKVEPFSITFPVARIENINPK